MLVQSSKVAPGREQRRTQVFTMRKMTIPTTEPRAARVASDQQELADRIAHALPRDGRVEPRPGLFFIRFSSPTQPVHAVVEPSFCVIAQGSKEILLGDDTFRYDPAHYLITTMGLPLSGQVGEGL